MDVPSPTDTVTDTPRDYTEDVGEGVIQVNEDFDAITGGNPEEFCDSAESAIAAAAAVSVDRVDATCTRG